MANGDLATVEKHDVVRVNNDAVFNSGFDIAALLPTAGQLELSDKQKEILYAPIVKGDIEIRPDGLLYLPWMEYQNRMNKAFGLQWCLIPEGNPKLKDNAVYWKFHLVVQGNYMTCTIGEQQYYPGYGMTYSDAVEGARSNALMRCCKHLGITNELWKPSFIREWKEKNAESYICKEGKNKGKTLWKRKGAEEIVVEHTQEEVPKPPPGAEPDYKKLLKEIREMIKVLAGNDDAKALLIVSDLGYKKTSEIPKEKLEEVHKIVSDDYKLAFISEQEHETIEENQDAE